MNRGYVWLAIAAVVGLGAFFAGRELKPTNEAFAFSQEFDATVYDDPPEVAAMSRGGFEGVGAINGLEGDVIFGGEVLSINDDQLTLRSAAGTQTLQLLPNARIVRLDAASGAIPAGATVIVRTPPGGDSALAVVIVAQP